MKDLGYYNCYGGVNGDSPTEVTYSDLIKAIKYSSIETSTITKIFLPKELIISINNIARFFPFISYPTIGFLKDENYEGIKAEFIIDENIKLIENKSANYNKIYCLYLRNEEKELEIRSTLA